MVAPFAGAWIEIEYNCLKAYGLESHPSRVRGLKSCRPTLGLRYIPVAPFAGAWIEMSSSMALKALFACRTLRGCVD